MVTHAERAHVRTAAASTGNTIYDGDQLSAETEGALRITSPAFRLHLGSQSILTLWHPDTTEDSVEADLAQGTLVFSMARNGSLSVVANDALIRPVAMPPPWRTSEW
jgi:hypothetical protein